MTDLVRALRARPLLAAACLLLAAGSPVQAQRHPESAGPLPYYRDAPGTEPIPAWQRRPPFARGPLDRYERGASRRFLQTDNGVPYLNFADERYILYERTPIPWFRSSGGRRFPHQWDRVGDYVGPAPFRVISWEETRTNSNQRLDPNAQGSVIDFIPSANTGQFGSNIAIGHYNYGPLHWTATFGARIRNQFTPLTLSQIRMDAARVDFDYADRDKVTLLLNRGRNLGQYSTWAKSSGYSFEAWPVLMYAAHYQRQFGSYAHLGGTFVNQFQSQPASPRSDAFRGDIAYPMQPPKVLRVQIADDSPDETQANALVYGVTIYASGRDAEGNPVRYSSARDAEGYAFLAALDVAPVGGRRQGAGGPWVAEGTDAVVFDFPLATAVPAGVTLTQAHFQADVADDYRIGLRHTYDFIGQTRQGAPQVAEMKWPADPIASNGRRDYGWDLQGREPFYTVARAEGGPRGAGNRRLVSFDYGMPTGQSLYSVDWKANLVGLRLGGEVAYNGQNYIYPIGDNEGERSTAEALAYWFTVDKDLPAGLQLGAELFRLDPDYSGGYDSQRGGMPFHLDDQSQPGLAAASTTQEYYLIDDNDDEDQWPDDLQQDYPGGNYPDSEVYPGLDANGDNVPDIDRNINYIPDWEEPFLMYDADPIDFVYGIDYNNNGLPDFRENDDLPDYPYRRDHRGFHTFLKLDGLGRFGESISAGLYGMEEIANAGESRGIYLRYAYAYDVPGVAAVRLDYDVKRVEDDIQDHSYRWLVAPDEFSKLNSPIDAHPDQDGVIARDGTVGRPATPDPLLMRDSWVHTAWVHSHVTRLQDVGIYNSVLLSRNSQAEIALDDGSGLLQPEDVVSRVAMVNKVDYTWNRGRWTFIPQLKHRLERRSRDSLDEPETSSSVFIPIVRGEYALTTNTSFLAGVQGLPLLPMKHWDRIAEDQTFTQKDYMAMLNVRSEYWGFATSVFLGVHDQSRNYSRLKSRDAKAANVFIDVVVGF